LNIDEYAERLLQETLSAAAAEPNTGFLSEIFTSIVAERLTIAGEFNEPEICYHRARGVEVSGWSLSDAGDRLYLLVTDYRGTARPESLTNSSIDTSFRRLSEFFVRSQRGYADQIEESSSAFELADLIYRQCHAFETVHMYLLSDARARSPAVAASVVGGIPITRHVWDLERLWRLDTSGLEHEPVAVDLVARLGHALPCLPGPPNDDHRVYLALVPGTLLAQLYGEYGSRLLERNVRAFLQARGAVNKGIRDTLLKDPESFLAYNNGISVTASSVKLSSSGHLQGLTHIADLQIVNGGQTTASIYHAQARDKADISGVLVQAKITVVNSGRIDSIVPNISRYANTQNRVTGADFSANDPFHIRLEELSRTIWAPAAGGGQRQTRWFYERARGQYADELVRAGTVAKRRQFQLMNPPRQKFTKTDVAKFSHSWIQFPHLVSLGAEKNFREFMLRLPLHADSAVDPGYFSSLIAKAILFRRTQKIVLGLKFGGYGANIVTYSIAKLSHSTAQRLDLDAIWRQQEITEATAAALAELATLCSEIISKPSGRVRNPSEWCKKIDCWKAVEELQWNVPAGLEQELIPLLKGRHARSEAVRQDFGAHVTQEEKELIREAAKISADTWFRLSNWAAKTGSLQPWQRGLAYSLGQRASANLEPTPKQATQGLRALEDALRLGFS
jgi:AIPR protein/Abortive infection phage resistance protein N-terminal domain